MADPITMGIAAVGIASGGMAMFGQHQGAKANEAMANYQASIADNNRKIAHAQGVQEEHRMRRQHRQQLGRQRAGFLESGIFGKSSLLALEESMINQEMDVMRTRTNALRKGQGFLMQRDMANYKEKQFGQAARRALVTGGMNMAKSALSGFGAAGAGDPSGGYVPSDSAGGLQIGELY